MNSRGATSVGSDHGTTATRDVEVAIVGGGPAGAALAARLGDAGHEVVLLERRAEPKWRASGVFTSPATVTEMHDLALDASVVRRLIRPVPELRVDTVGGRGFTLSYAEHGGAAGLDRVAVDRALLDHAAAHGAEVRRGEVVTSVELPGRRSRARAEITASGPDGATRYRAAVLVGADGPRSLVARTAGVTRDLRIVRRAGMTGHHEDPDAAVEGAPMAARLCLGEGWYLGVTPVPGGRVNAGVVIRGGAFQRGVREHGRPEGLHRSIVEQMPAPWERWRDAPATDTVVTSFPLGHRVTRAAGNGFLLVGDAAGYVDPLSGEGIHRAFVSARMAASAIGASLAGESRALETYSERLRERFARKDLVSWLLQMFTSRPAMTDYVVERLARRGELRRTFLLVMADLAPVERALRPRFLAALFAP